MQKFPANLLQPGITQCWKYYICSLLGFRDEVVPFQCRGMILQMASGGAQMIRMGTEAVEVFLETGTNYGA